MALPIGLHTHPGLSAVPSSKVKLTASPRLLGRTTAGAGSAEEITVGAGLTLAAGTLTASAAPANPSASVGLAAVNGSASTYMRSDAAPALSQAIVPTWTGTHTFLNNSGSYVHQYQRTSATARTYGLGLTPTGLLVLDDITGTQRMITYYPSVIGEAVNGWLFVGSAGPAPTNITNGDLTFTRGFGTTVDMVTGYRIGGAAPAGHYLRGNGTNYVDGTIQASDLPANGANPTASVGLAAVNGSATTWMRSDAAPPLSQAITPTWTGIHTYAARAAGATVISNPTIEINSQTGLSGARTVILHGENNAERILIGSNGFAQYEGAGYGGTWSAPTRTTTNMQLVRLAAFGYDNAGTPAFRGTTGFLTFLAGSDWTTTSLDTYALLGLVPAGSTVAQTVFQWMSTGFLGSGYGKVGGISAPSNVSAGDFTATRLHLGTDAAFSSGMSFETNAIRSNFGGSLTISTTLGALVTLSGVVTNNADNVAALSMLTELNGNGANAFGTLAFPRFSPSANMTQAIGFAANAQMNPAAGVTISLAVGGRGLIQYVNNVGAITTGYSLWAFSPVISGSVAPTNQYGVVVENQGATGITNAFGLWVAHQTGATNNFDMGFGTVDTAGGAGAYYGRIPVYYNGLLKYMRLYDS